MLGQIAGLGTKPSAKALGPDGEELTPPDLADRPATASEALPAVLPCAREALGGKRLDALGHRVVQGGMQHTGHERVTAKLLAELESLIPLAPLHQPHNLAAIRAALVLNPGLPQVACFDTAFHRSVPEVAQTFAIPRNLHDAGVRRYGFHGLSCEYLVSVLPKYAPQLAEGRVIIAHLGNGASLSALRGGTSIASTMGFSVLDGLPMGTRCGELDPGVLCT